MMGFLVEAGLAGWIGAIGSVFAVILTIIIYVLTRKKKALSYEVLSEYPLISIDDEIKGKLQLLYDGNPVENVHLLLVKFINSGNIPITTSDFERPLTVHLKGASKVLSAEPIKPSPDNLTVSLNVEDQIITVQPVLMNGGDFFTAKVLIGQYSGSFNVDARVVGVKSIRTVRRQSQADWWARYLKFSLIGATAVIFMAASISLFISLTRDNRTPPVNSDKTTEAPPRDIFSPTPERTPYEISFSNTNSLTVGPNSGRASVYPSDIVVSEATGIIHKLTVEISGVSHTCMGDVAILLVGPNGKSVVLMADIDGCGDIRNANMVFDDDAPITSLFKGDSSNSNLQSRPNPTPSASPTSIPLGSGTYRPTNNKKSYKFPTVSLTEKSSRLSVFNGTDPNGKWSLYVVDDAVSDSGKISAGWKLIMKLFPASPSPTR